MIFIGITAKSAAKKRNSLSPIPGLYMVKQHTSNATHTFSVKLH